jgi:hypothetical protein
LVDSTWRERLSREARSTTIRRRHFKPEQVIHMLQEAEIKLASGKTTGEVCRETHPGVTQYADPQEG